MALSEAEKAKEALRAKYLAVGEKVSERAFTVSAPVGEDVLTIAASNHAMKQVEALLHSEAQESSSAITVLQVGHSTARLTACPPLTHALHALGEQERLRRAKRRLAETAAATREAEHRAAAAEEAAAAATEAGKADRDELASTREKMEELSKQLTAMKEESMSAAHQLREQQWQSKHETHKLEVQVRQRVVHVFTPPDGVLLTTVLRGRESS